VASINSATINAIKHLRFELNKQMNEKRIVAYKTLISECHVQFIRSDIGSTCNICYQVSIPFSCLHCLLLVNFLINSKNMNLIFKMKKTAS